LVICLVVIKQKVVVQATGCYIY